MKMTHRIAIGWLVVLCLSSLSVAQQSLPSWNDGKTRQAIEAFVQRVTTPGSADFVPPAERIAVFDNDGTLWSEQPMYVQLAFALNRVKALAPEHPEWKDQAPFNAVLSGDLKALGAAGERGLMELILATHAGMTSDEFEKVVKDWIATAKHPVYQRPYTECVYQPMRELLEYLRAHEFKTYIVSGGGIEFMRPWSEAVYGIPPEQVIGTSIKLKYVLQDGRPVLVRLPEIDFIDDKAGKPVGIHRQIGRRPIAAFGNSDGDWHMLRYTTEGPGRRLGMILRHDDADREYAYDRDSHVGRLARALDEAPQRGWQVISMREDWARVFA